MQPPASSAPISTAVTDLRIAPSWEARHRGPRQDSSVARAISLWHHAARSHPAHPGGPMRRALAVPASALFALALFAAPASFPARAASDRAAPAPGAAGSAPGPRFAVHAAHLVDGRAAAARGPVWVVISGDTIESVRASAPGDLSVVELGNATLLPGLIDCHTHLSSRVGLPPTERFKSTAARAAIAGVNSCRNTLFAGITTCRDVGGAELVDVGLRDAIKAGEIPGP